LRTARKTDSHDSRHDSRDEHWTGTQSRRHDNKLTIDSQAHTNVV